ncbi:MAG: TetR family transcriptional regulator [Actinomycetota bacterium]|nr:TetR family transcriptional regulator [Actinomycetota bacterium]
MLESETPRSPVRAQQPLARQAVIEAALRFVDREGSDALSMRRLGSQLGAGTMTLYNHVANKDDLLDAVAELLWNEVSSRISITGDWRADVRAVGQAISRVAWDHPHAYPMMLDRGVVPAGATRIAADLAESLQTAGFDQRTEDAVRTVIGYAAGYTMCEVAWYGDPAAAMAAGAQPQPDAADDDEGRRMILECDTAAQFAFGLEVLLDGLEQLLSEAQGVPAS